MKAKMNVKAGGYGWLGAHNYYEETAVPCG